MITVVLVDDHALVRAGFKALLEGEPDIEVVGEAEDGRRALEVVRAAPPDVLVLDLTLPELNGLEVITRLRSSNPEVRILVVSMHADGEYVARALREGASGYMVKDAAEPEFAVAVRAIASGRRYLSPTVADTFVDQFLVRRRHPSDPFEVLTPRQREILQLIAEGHSTSEIAEKLHISAKTVETHRADLMKRLDIHDVAGLVRYAIRKGMASLEE